MVEPALMTSSDRVGLTETPTSQGEMEMIVARHRRGRSSLLRTRCRSRPCDNRETRQRRLLSATSLSYKSGHSGIGYKAVRQAGGHGCEGQTGSASQQSCPPVPLRAKAAGIRCGRGGGAWRRGFLPARLETVGLWFRLRTRTRRPPRRPHAHRSTALRPQSGLIRLARASGTCGRSSATTSGSYGVNQGRWAQGRRYRHRHRPHSTVT